MTRNKYRRVLVLKKLNKNDVRSTVKPSKTEMSNILGNTRININGILVARHVKSMLLRMQRKCVSYYWKLKKRRSCVT